MDTKISAGVVQFQPTLPVWEVTRGGLGSDFCVLISTHTPRVGSDNFHPAPDDNNGISTHTPLMGE